MSVPRGTLLNKVVRDLIVIIPMLILTVAVIRPKEICSFLGLTGNVIKGFAIALFCVAPLYLVFPFFGGINDCLTFELLLQKSILPGFKEEFICRAFMFGLLFRYARTGFFWAVILPALYFGSLHLYQGLNITKTLKHDLFFRPENNTNLNRSKPINELQKFLLECNSQKFQTYF